MKNKKGFSLVEILAVIVLISLIIIIAVPSVKSISVKSKKKLFDTKVKLTEEAVNLWGNNNKSCFTEDEGCKVLDNCEKLEDTITCTTTFKKLADNGIINYDEEIKDDKYVVNPVNSESLNDEVLIVKLERGVVNTECDIAEDAGEYIERGDEVEVEEGNTSNKVPAPVSFATDSWETIAEAVVNNNTSLYNVGDTKEIEITGLINGETGSNGLYTVRIANMSTSELCGVEGFSQSACGFVVEFVDIIEKRQMNTSDTNVGGWPATSLRTYLNGDTSDHLTYGGTNATIYSKLPSDLQSVIIDTYVVSGHGLEDKNTKRYDENWISIDKLYLFTVGEIYSNCLTGSGCYDTASYPYNGSGATTTKLLDYYANKGVTIQNYSAAIKQYAGTDDWWWLRAPYSAHSNGFGCINCDDYWYNWHGATYSRGVAPAFRIG